MKRLLFSMMIIPLTALFGGEGIVTISCEKPLSYIYIDGKKRVKTGDSNPTIITLKEGEHIIKLVKPISPQYQMYTLPKRVFIGAGSSMNLVFRFTIDNGYRFIMFEPTESYKEELKKKDIPKLKRFEREKDVVTDTKLGLMWQDDSEKSDRSKYHEIEESKQYCQELSLLGYSDWRVPTYKELLSIVDYDRYNPSIMPLFKNVVPRAYWTSSDSLQKKDEDAIWQVSFVSGFTIGDKGKYHRSRCHTRCVRNLK